MDVQTKKELFFQGNIRGVLQHIQSILSCLHTTDFCIESGINESSIKTIIIGYVQSFNGIIIQSEKPLKDNDTWKFIDLVVIDKDTNRKVLIELKYIKTCFLLYKDDMYVLPRMNRHPRNVLHKEITTLKELSYDDKNKLRYVSYGNKTTYQVRTLVLQAKKQLVEYANIYNKDCLLMIFVGYGPFIRGTSHIFYSSLS